MVRVVPRGARPGALDLGGPAVRPDVPADPALSDTSHGLDAAERERRSHIRRWATFMIVHLDRQQHDDARHYSYEEALERLQALIARELDEVRSPPGGEPLARTA